jgi:hypothetical protein
MNSASTGDNILTRLAIILSVIVGLVAVGATAQSTPISARDAKSHVGSPVSVEDVVAQVSREPQSGVTYLNFGGEFPNQVFRAVIPDAVWSQIRGAVIAPVRVRVTGVPRLDRGVAEIVCSELSQFTRLDTAVKSATVPLPVGQPQPQTRSCCRVCTTGKPCGNSCISRSFTCRQPPGCACAP